MALMDRLRLFEPMLDGLMRKFGVDPDPGSTPTGDPVFDAYRRCEIMRSRLGDACQANPDAVRRHADEITRAILHDHCPSGDRRLVKPLVGALGSQEVLARLLGHLETGTAIERLGAAMGLYWASGDACDPLAEESNRALATRFRDACLRAYLASDDPADSRYYSFHFTLDPADYPPDLHEEVAEAARIAGRRQVDDAG